VAGGQYVSRARNGGFGSTLLMVGVPRVSAFGETGVAETRDGCGRADKVSINLLVLRRRSLPRQAGSAQSAIAWICNAGASKTATIEDTTVDGFDKLLTVNVRAPFFLVEELPTIPRNGSSVLVLASLAVHSSVDTLSAYSVTKGAVGALVKPFAVGARLARHPRHRGRAPS
jgi:3-oxoacyl-[acyl-carrier protein] reductase